MQFRWQSGFHGGQRVQGGDVVSILLAAVIEGPPVLVTDEGLRGADPLGLVVHVQPVALDGSMQVLAAILTDPEAVDALVWIPGKGLQFPAVCATAFEVRRLRPVRGLGGREFAAGKEKASGVLP